MAGINEELALTRKAKAAIEKLQRREKIIEHLRNANIIARRATSTEGSLNGARQNARIALGALIPALEAELETLELKLKAKVAVNDWIKELEAAKR